MAMAEKSEQLMGKEELDALWAKIKNTFFASASFTQANIQSTLGISNWALASSEPSYAFSDITGTASSSQIPTLAISKIDGLQTALNNKLETSLKGAAYGLAELDANGLVPASQLPSYVDDVLEYASTTVFPSTGVSGKIYVALDTNLTYRWSGTTYVEISQSLALGETSSTAYRGDRGATAYTHATDTSRLTTAQTSGFYKFATTAEGHIASVTAVTASDLNSIYGFTISGTASQTYNLATIASNASNGATAYGWGNHASAGYALASNLGTASTHAHGDYVTAIGVSGNTLTWSKGGTAQTAITVPYASSSGNADTVDGEHASAFAHVGKWNNLLVSGNEFNFISNGFIGIIWLNYQDGNRQNDANIQRYVFGNGRRGLATVNANGFIHGGYNTSSYVLTSDGGAAPISGLSVNYATTAGSAPASDVYAWAKASTKPSYSLSEISNRYQSLISWGGPNISDSVSPLEVATIDDLGHNKLAFASATSVTIQYSRDGGSTWVDYEASNDDKRKLVTTTTSFYIGRRTGASNTTDDKLRVILNSNNAGGNVYTVLRRLLLHISTRGSQGCSVKVEYRYIRDYKQGLDVWHEIGTFELSGWSGWNSIPFESVFGGSNSQETQTSQVRLTFGVTSVSTTYPNLTLIAIRGIGFPLWQSPSNMASNGHLYSFDISQNAAFPAGVSAISFTENGTALSSKYLGINANAVSATKLATARSINGTSFDGTADITTVNWGTARNISIADSDSSNTGTAVSVNGSAAVTLKLPATIKAALSGNATSATQLETSRNIWGQPFNGTSSIGGNMSSVGDISFSASGKNIGGIAYFDTTNSRLGIGTSSPSYKLDVYGDIYASNGWIRTKGSRGWYSETYGGGWYCDDYTYVKTCGNRSIYTAADVLAGGNIVGTKGVASQGIANLSVAAISGSNFVTQVKIGSTAYNPSDGVVSLPAYPTVPTALSGFTNDVGYITGISSANVTTALGYTPAKRQASTETITGAIYDAASKVEVYDIWTPSGTTATFKLPYDCVYDVVNYVLIVNTLSSDITVSFTPQVGTAHIIAPSNSLVVPAGKAIEVSYLTQLIGSVETVVLSWSNAFNQYTIQ